MLQIKGFHARVFGGVIQQFHGKNETEFSTTHSNICISLALCRFSDDFHRNKFEFKTTYHNTNPVNRTWENSRKCISNMKYKCNSRPKPLRTVINFRSSPKGMRQIIDPMIRLQIAQISDLMKPCPEWIR